MQTSPKIGEVRFLKGFCTNALNLHGHPLQILERNLGFGSGRLAAGASVFFLDQLLTPEDFRLGGYTYYSSGALRGHKLRPEDVDANRMEALLKREHGWSDQQLRDYKQKMIGRTICLNGHQRIAKLVPAAPGIDYPPGAGVFQIEVIRKEGVRFRLKATISAGQTWLGDYTDPR
jgi:hypothetical protein